MGEQSSEAILRKYLLADLDDVERDKIEERLFSDERFAEDLTRAEASLVDDYALKVLSEHDRDLFEQNFILNAERRQNLLFAQTVNAYLEQEISDPVKPYRRFSWKNLLLFLQANKGWAVAAGAAAVVLLVLFIAGVVRWSGPNDQLAAMRAEREHRLAALNRQPPSSQAPPAAELSLQPSSLLRSDGELKQIEIPKGVTVLNLTFILPAAQHSKYIVITRKIEGDELFSIPDLSPEVNEAASLHVRIFAEFLPTDDYQFEVKGISADGKTSDVGLYNLRVVNSAPQP
jgi:hypothetical protein